MEFIRLNQNVLGPFTWAHLLSALLAVAAATALIVLHHRR
jgi:hypothetical protein